MPYGRRVRLESVTLGNIARILGHDETGVSSYCSAVAASGTLSLFRNVTVHQQASPSYQNASDAVHMDNAGAYISRDAYLVFDRDDRPVEPIASAVRAIAEPGSPIYGIQVSADIGAFVDVAYGNGWFVAVTNQGFIYRTNTNGETWDGPVASFTGMELVSVDYGNGVWLASSNNGYIFRSDSDGESGSWQQSLVGTSPWPTGAVSYGGDSDWYITGMGTSGSNGGILKSSNGGANWTQVEKLYRSPFPSTRTWRLERVATDVSKSPSARLYAGVTAFRDPRQSEIGFGAVNEVFIDTKDRGESFNFASATLACNDPASWPNPGRVYSAYDYNWTEWCGSYMCAINDVGNVAVSGDLGGPCGISTWHVAATLAGIGKGRKVKYNRTTGTIAVVGGVTAPRVWLGTRPSSLTRSSEIEEMFSGLGATAVHSVAFNENGDGLFVGSNGIIVSGAAAPGLREGTYNLYFVSYFNTKAGRFVYAMDRQEVTFNRLVGNTVRFEAQTRESILANNAWLAGMADQAAAEAIVDSLRFDTYIQYKPTAAEIGEDSLTFTQQSAEFTIRYAFTSPYPELAGAGFTEIERSIGELPIGRQIVSRGAPTTVVFEKSRTEVGESVRSRTAVHSGRVWGLAAQDEDRWPQGDGISFEIANQFNRFVLTHTETGWANLVSDQSFIPIQPTQSANFTGIVSTPSGLMVMFDNEIFLVTGDPSFGNVTVELFLDMVGCDLGTTPARMGGLVFVVWDGRVWAVQAAQVVDISRTQWRPEDPFVRVTAEPQTRSILAVTTSGRVLRYFLDDQFWMTDPVNRDDFVLGELLPNCVCGPDDFTRFVQPTGEVWITKTDGTPDVPHIVYRDMDFGFPERRTPLYVTKMTFEGPLVGAEFDRAAGGYNAAALPGLFYEAGAAANGQTHQTINALSGGIAPVMGKPGTQRVGTVTWRLPLGTTRSFSMGVRLELRGMTYADVIKPPIRFFHAAGGETR